MIKKVLIVDDISANLYMLETLLKGYGLEVTSAENGKVALDKAHLNPPDLIVTDILMPVMDGYALCRQWKSDDKLKHIPLVFYTATYTDPKDERFALSLGADGFILKPQEPDIFMNILKEVFGEKYTARQVVNKPLGEEMEFFRKHNEILFEKLEKKMSDLEIVNQKLRMSEEKYRTILEDMDDVYFEVDIKGNITFVNPSSCKMSGYSEEELLGMSFKKISAPDGIQMVKQYFGEIFLTDKTGKPFLWNLVKKNGEQGFFELVASLIRDKQGKSIGFKGIGRDVTERKRAEEANVRAALEWQMTFDSTSDMIWLLDSEQRVVRSNKKSEQFFKRPCGELVGKHCWEIVHGTTAPIPECPILWAKKSLRRETMELQIGDGWFSITVDPILDATGQYKGAVHMVGDITERKLAEEKLRESERKFRETVFNLDEGYYSVTLNGVLLEHNQALSRILGFDQAADLQGKQMPDFWQNPDERNSYLKELAAKGSINSYQIKAKTKTGEKITVIISAHLVKDKDNLPLKIEGVVLDITERKRFEDQLRASETLLRAIVDSTPFPMALVDVEDDKVEYWSRGALELFGHTAPTSTEWYQLAYPDPEYRRDVIERWKPFLETARLCGKPVNTGEYTVACHDGSARICELYATFLSDRLIVTFNDITERKQAEESLKEKTSLLRISGKLTKLGGWSVDLQNNLCTWSDETAAIHERPAGYSPLLEEGISYYSPEWRDKITKVFTQCAQNGIPYDEEMEIITGNGKRVWVRTIGEPVKDASGKIIKVQGAFQDITERTQAEELLRLKNHVFDTSIAANSIADVAGVIKETNHSFLKIWGYSSRDEAIGKPISYFLNDPEEAVAIVNALNEHGKWQGNFTAKKKDGSTFLAHSMATSIQDKNGKVKGYQSSVMDITEHRRAESQREDALEEIRKLNETLEQRITGRTLELRKTIELLEETNRVFVGRELRMIELKERIAELEKKENVKREE